MNIMTEDGIDIYVLPENAHCRICGQSPEKAAEKTQLESLACKGGEDK